MARNSDQPGPRTSIAALSKKAEKRRKEPYVLELDSPQNTLTFPDPGQMLPGAAEEMLTELMSPTVPLTQALRRWLSTEKEKKAYDKALLDGTIPDFTALREVSRAVTDYYGEIFGSPGEEPASQG